MSIDHEIRLAAFRWLSELVTLHGDVLPWTLLSHGFLYDNHRIPLVSPQGIFRPRQLQYPLTIRTAPEGPMLQHGIKELHQRSMIMPRANEYWPDRTFLDWRYQRFRNAV
jgi:hypothetical protein